MNRAMLTVVLLGIALGASHIARTGPSARLGAVGPVPGSYHSSSLAFQPS